MGRWDAELDAFAAADRDRMPPRGGVVLTGSSSIVRWESLAEDLPGLPVLNRGFGGSRLAEVVEAVPRVVAPYRPRIVVIYAGSHDVHGGATPETVAAGFARFAAAVHGAAPGCAVLVLTLKPSLSKWSAIAKDAEVNRLAALAAPTAGYEVVDIWAPMLAGQERPSPSLFAPDRNHLSREGYRVWGETLAPRLRALLAPAAGARS